MNMYRKRKDGAGMTDLKDIRLFLLDMDGTLYLGDNVIDGAVEFIELLEKQGKKYIYLTNNSSRAGADYVGRLRGLGFPCEKENVFTSGMASAMYILERYPGKKVYVMGTKALEAEIGSYGIPLSRDADVVLVGFDRELTYEKLDHACRLIRGGAPFIACNPDWVCPLEGGDSLPDCGSICACITAATGVKPFYIGKPRGEMAELCAKAAGVDISLTAAVGDRLYTDIACAVNAGAASVCVLSGETNMETIMASDIKPDHIFPSVKELAEAIG